jgi:integrase
MAGVEMRTRSRWWYGTLTVKGKRRILNLGIAVAGTRPSHGLPDGDETFRNSRTKAELKIEAIRADAQRKAKAEEVLQALQEVRTGHRVGTISLPDLYARWCAIPRRRPVGEAYAAWARAVFHAFAEFASKLEPPKSAMIDILREDAAAFMSQESARGVSARTWNAELGLLKGAFERLRRQAGLPENPFDETPTREEAPVHRRPFSADDLRAIYEAALSDDFVRPLIVAGMCTAMRLGDVCMLRWQDVDTKNRFITVKTGKTGARVSIPMFAMLASELTAAKRSGLYVFPEAAALYESRPDVVQRRLQETFRRAGFYNPKDQDARWTTPERPEGWQEKAASAIREARIPDTRRKKLLQVLDLYAGGATTSTVAATAAISRGSVSHYLHEIERLSKIRIVRRRETPPAPETPHRENMWIKPEKGLRKASVHGFHSFRTTWVTLALTAGVPIDLVRKVTGHRTADIVLANYFQPGREHFRKLLQSKMPALLSNGAKTPNEQAVEILRGATTKTWRKCIEQAIALIEEPAA